MNIIRKINYGIILSHGAHDIFLKDFYIYYTFFPLLFLILSENLIYLLIVIKSIIHFSNDLSFLPNPFPYMILSTGIIVGYHFRRNKITLNIVQGYLFFHSVYNISLIKLNYIKICVLMISFIITINDSYFTNTIHELIYNTESPMTLKKKLIYSIVCAHIRSHY